MVFGCNVKDSETGCPITCPIAGLAICIREEIIRFQGPLEILRVLGLDILLRAGVESVDSTVLIHIVDQLVQILEPAPQIMHHSAILAPREGGGFTSGQCYMRQIHMELEARPKSTMTDYHSKSVAPLGRRSLMNGFQQKSLHLPTQDTRGGQLCCYGLRNRDVEQNAELLRLPLRICLDFEALDDHAIVKSNASRMLQVRAYLTF